jgi:hypothetical protein
VFAISIDRFRDLFEAFGEPPGLPAKRGWSHALIDDSIARLPHDAPLLHALSLVEALSTTGGPEAIEDARVDAGIASDSWPMHEGLPSLAAWLVARSARDPSIARMLDRAELAVLRGAFEGRPFFEFRAGRALPSIRGEALDEALRALFARMGAVFGGTGRLAWADGKPFDGEEAHVVWIQVRRTERAKTFVAVRPEGHALAPHTLFALASDVLRIDLQEGLLSIATRAPRLAHAYREAVGAELFGDAACFSNAPTYTLDPLCERGRAALDARALAAQIADVRLVAIAWDSHARELQTIEGHDCFDALERDGVRLRGAHVHMARVRFATRAGKGRNSGFTIWPPHGVRIPKGEHAGLVRDVIYAFGFATPIKARRDLWNAHDALLTEAAWRAIAGERAFEAWRARGILVAEQVRAVAHDAHEAEGRALIALPVEREPGAFYGVSAAPLVPSKSLAPSEMAAWRLDPKKLARAIGDALGLAGAPRVFERPGLIDAGSFVAGGRAVRVVVVLAEVGDGAHEVGERLRELRKGESIVAIVPQGRRAELDIAEVALADWAPPFDGLLASIVRALGIGDALGPLALAPPGTRLVIDAKNLRAWLDGVEMTRLRERHVRLLLVLAKRGAPVPSKEADDEVSPGADGAARDAKRELPELFAASFKDAKKKGPRDLDAIVVREGRRGYRLAVAAFVA